MYICRLYRYVDVAFEPSFDKALHVARTMSKHQNSIIATQYNLIDSCRQRKYAHHICLCFNQNGTGFMFDPLGEVTCKEKIKMEVYKYYPIIRDYAWRRYTLEITTQSNAFNIQSYVYV